MGQIALKVDVDSLRGTLEGVPNLSRLIDQAKITATFLFSLGPDHTGWALKRIFRPGFLKKVSRTSVLEHYGLKTLLYGVLLPAPDIGIKGQTAMREVMHCGHEIGIHTWDHIVWQDHVRHATPEWTLKHMQAAWDRFNHIFKRAPTTHGAAGWQMNSTAFEQLDHWQLPYASDGRAPLNLMPYRINMGKSICKHIQYPTTLPTFDELIGVKGMSPSDAVDYILRLTANNPNDQVFTLHAELEGQKLLPMFTQLLQGWFAQGHECVSMQKLHQSWLSTGQLIHLATQPILWGEVPNRSGEMIIISPEKLNPSSNL